VTLTAFGEAIEKLDVRDAKLCLRHDHAAHDASASANTVSSGSAITSAMTFGRTSSSSGAMPMVRMASISSVTAMVPICAA